jgi:hypothetical protein
LPVRVSVTVTVAPPSGWPASLFTWPWIWVVICCASAAVMKMAFAAIGMARNAHERSKSDFFTG